MCGASVSGYVTTQLEWSRSAVFGPDRCVFVISGMVSIVAHWGTSPRSVDRSGLAWFVVQIVPQVMCVSPSCCVPICSATWCRLVFELDCRFVSTTRWSVGRIVCWKCWLQCLLVELWYQFALWVTFGWAFESIFLGFQDLSPSISE